jgi:predicted RNA-binding Zn ribbon-like protein
VIAIELANTAAERPDPLAGGAGLTAWMTRRRRPHQPPPGPFDDADAAAMRSLRAAIRDLLLAQVEGRAAAPSAVDQVNAAAVLAPSSPQLHWPPGGPPSRWESTAAVPDRDAALAAAARSAIELLAGPRRARLQSCPGNRCGNLFVAESGRRWCSYACGNRARVARHAAAHRRPA